MSAENSVPIITGGETVIVVLTELTEWQDSVTHAAQLAAASDRRLRVILADGDELVSAAGLHCARILAHGGLLSTFDLVEARRLVKAHLNRLRQGLPALAARYAIEIELVEAPAVTDHSLWTGSTALTVFGRRRRGVIMVVYAGTAATLDVAARLAAEQRQTVSLLRTAGADLAVIGHKIGPWLTHTPQLLDATAALPAPSHGMTIAALVIDPAWLASNRLTVQALRDQWLKLRAVRRMAAVSIDD